MGYKKDIIDIQNMKDRDVFAATARLEHSDWRSNSLV
jgi:hypothetical protein